VKAVFWLGIMFPKQISRLLFKQSRINMLIPHIYVLGQFLSFFGDVYVYLEEKSFSQQISKIYENWKFCCFKTRT